MDKVDELFERIDQLPPAPGVLPRVLALLTREDSDLGEVADMIAIDPALTAKLLQTCNSAFFGKTNRVNDVGEAVHQLGFRNVYRVVAVVSGTQCLKPFRTIGLDVNRLWRHLVTTAFAAQFIAADAGLPDGLLFTAGLLHDVGKFLLAQAFGNPYTDLLSNEYAIGAALAVQERELFGFDHAQVGGRLLERWNFSRQLVVSVQFHHDPASASEHRPLAAAVSLADALAHNAAADFQTDLKAVPESETALALCNLSPQAVARYEEQIRENVNFVEAMCRLAA